MTELPTVMMPVGLLVTLTVGVGARYTCIICNVKLNIMLLGCSSSKEQNQQNSQIKVTFTELELVVVIGPLSRLDVTVA